MRRSRETRTQGFGSSPPSDDPAWRNGASDPAPHRRDFEAPHFAALLRIFTDLARAVGILPATLEPSREIVKHNCDGLPRVGLECTLGKLQRNAKETFVPLVVKRVAAEV